MNTMADDTPDLDLNTVIPLLQSTQNQDAAKQSSKAALGLAGKIFAPNLYDLVTQPKPQPGQLPPPGTVGKVPQQDAMDPRMVPAMRDIGMLGLGGIGGRLTGSALGSALPKAAGIAEGAVGSAGRNIPRLTDQSGVGRALVGAGSAEPPVTEAKSAPRLTREQRQQLEVDRQRQENENAAEAARTKTANEAEAERVRNANQAEIDKQKAAAQTKIDIENQQRANEEAAAKAEREKPFREKHSTAAQLMPAGGMAASLVLPWLKGMASKVPLDKFASDWEKAGNAAQTALKGKTKMPAKIAVNQLREYENKWPDMEKRFTPGVGQTALTSMIPAEMAAFPTEYDAMTQPPGSPSKPTAKDWEETLGRSAIAGGAGTGFAKLGAGLAGKVKPYVGGQGLISAYNQKYPPTKTELKAALQAKKGK